MAAYAALLRGIAPMNPKMRNAQLRRVFEGLGFDDVRTVISSGNVLFASPDRSTVRLERRIEAALLHHLDRPCTAVLRTRRAIADLARSDSFDGHDDGPAGRCHVTFLQRRPTVSPPDLRPHGTLVDARAREVLTVIDGSGPGASAAMALLERHYGTAMTTRTWRTVHRINAAFER